MHISSVAPVSSFAAAPSCRNGRRRCCRASRAGPVQTAASFSRARAFDVVVVGSGLSGLLAAYRLSGSLGGGRKVAVVDVAPARANKVRGAPRSFHLPHAEELNTFLAAEAQALWTSLGHDAGTQLLLPYGSLQVLLPGEEATLREVQEAGRPGRLEQLEANCTAAQIPYDVLAPDQVRSRFPFLRAPPESHTLYQTSGGVLFPDEGRRVLERLCVRSGVDIRNDHLAGWRDGGGYFQIRTSDGAESGGGSISSGALIEAEQLVLAPSQVDAEKVLQMFGLRGGLQRVESLVGEWPAMSDMSKCPLVRVMQNDLDVLLEDSPGLSLVPRLEGSARSQVTLSPFVRSKATTQEIEEMRRQQEEEEEQGEPVQEGSVGGASHRLPVDLQVAMTSLSALVARITSGLDLSETPDRAFITSELTTADGFSLLGSHPGWEEGQVVVAVPTLGAHGDGGAGLSGSLGLLAASAVQGVPNPYGINSADRLALTRASLEMQAGLLNIDTWTELGTLTGTRRPTSKKMVPTTRPSRASKERKYYM